MFAAVSFALAALSAVKAAPVPVVDTTVALPNSTQVNQTAYWYEQNGNAGACGSYSTDSDVVVGLPLEFYEDYSTVSPYCGSFVVVEGNNKTVTALVADASTLNDTLTLSIAAWRALDGDNGLKTVDWRFANETESAAAAEALENTPATSVVETPATATSAKAPTSTSSYAAATPSSSSVSYAAATTSWAAEKQESASSSAPWTSTSSSAEWTPSSSSSSAWQSSSAASSSSWDKEASSSSTWSPEPSSTTTTEEWKASSTSIYEAPKTSTTTTSVWKPTTTTSQYVAPTTTTTTQAPATTQQTSSSSSSGTYSGQATYYSQGGAAGSCGNYASDSDYVVAVNAAQMNSGWCGRTVSITNTANGKSITATVADTCPGCGYGSLDLSVGAFGAIGEYDTGVLPITWSFA